MKIAVLSTANIPSTRANSLQTMKVCQALAQLGEDVCLWVPGNIAHAWEDLASPYGVQEAFPIRFLPTAGFWRRYDFAWKAVEAAHRWQAEVIYTRALPAAMLALQRRMPVILELHDLPAGRIGKSLFRNYLALSGRKTTVFITEALRRLVGEAYGVDLPDKNNPVLPDGIDLERYANLPPAAEARRRLGLAEGFTLGYTGSFYQGRGIELLASLAGKLLHMQHLWIGGSGEVLEKWRKNIQDEAWRHVHLAGYISNDKIPIYQAAADVLLMPYGRSVSGSSGGDIARVFSPLKMFEYMAAGRPIVAADLPVLHEILDERTAVFCPVEDEEAWVNALQALMDDPQRREQLASAAREKVQSYSWKARMQAILAIHESNKDQPTGR